MKNKFVLLVLIAMLVVFAAACQPKETSDQGQYKDGKYEAELDPDERGWKAIVDLTVDGGKITEVTFDEVNAEGVRKSENEEYLERWGTAANIDASKVYGEYEEALIDTQDVEKVEVITGATQSHEKFQKVVTKALQ